MFRAMCRLASAVWRSTVGLLVVLGSAQPGLAQEEVFTDDLRILKPFPTLTFDDDGLFPQTWQLQNQEYFVLHDVSWHTYPLIVEPGAPDYSLFIQYDGTVEVGALVAQTLDVITCGCEPASIRLTEFSATPSMWDVEGGGFGFNIKDITGGTTPFSILPGAPTDSLFIDVNGNVGMGTSTPQTICSVALSDDARHLNLDAGTGRGRCIVQGDAGAESWLVHKAGLQGRKAVRTSVADGRYKISTMQDNMVNNVEIAAICIDLTRTFVGVKTSNPTQPFQVGDPGVQDGNGAHVTKGGVWTNASSRTIKEDIQPITSELARETVRALQPVGYRYKNEPDEMYIGFIAEDVPELVATNDRKSLASMDITAVLTKVVQDQDRQLEEERQRNDRLEATLASVKERLAELERKAERGE